jgi:DHA2 family multidrug resistance protein
MAFILGFGLYGSTLIIPIYAIHFGLTATDAGLLLIPGSTTAFMMPIIGNSKRSAARVHDWCWVLVFFYLP